MLKLNLQRVLVLRGIENPVAFMLKIGLSRTITYNILGRREIAVRYQDLEKLCAALNCTPNDIFDWQPDAKTDLPETHSLHSIKRETATATLKSLMNDLPIEQLVEVQNFIGELKNRDIK